MSDFNIEVVEFQIASEVKIKEDGKATFSIRAVARLAGTDDSKMGKALRGAGTLTTKLATFLIEQGFEVRALQEVGQKGIPDLLAAAILEYYAFEAGSYCTEQARQVCRAFLRIGIRAYAQHIAGWKPQPIDYEAAIIAVLKSQIPEEPTKWQKRFISSFWNELERLYGLKRGDNGCQNVIAAYVYRYFPVEVLNRLDEINPILSNGYRKNKQHQHFDRDLEVLLRNHIAKVIILMEGSTDKADFIKAMRRVPRIKFNNSNVTYLDAKHSAMLDHADED